jgi:hypothetical protein
MEQRSLKRSREDSENVGLHSSKHPMTARQRHMLFMQDTQTHFSTPQDQSDFKPMRGVESDVSTPQDQYNQAIYDVKELTIK